MANADPRLVLKNTSDAKLTVRSHFLSGAGEEDNPVELPSLTLQAQQLVEVDLSDLRVAAATRTDLASVSVQVLNDGAPGSLIGSLYSTDRTTQLTYDVPLRDSGKMRNASGSYPWRLDDDYSTVVVITNIGNQPARFQIEIRYAGGPYSIKQRELAVGETASFDLRRMRDEQQPDRTGKTLPRDLQHGQFHWSLANTFGEPRIVGRAEVASVSKHVSSSYSCPTCCPDSNAGGAFDPNAYGLFIDGYALTNARGEYYDCYGNSYTGSLGWNFMWTDNTAIATINSSTEQLHGTGTGETQVAGSYNSVEWFTDGMDCYSNYYNGSDSAPVDVTGPPHHVKVLADQQGYPQSCQSTGIWVRQIQVQVVDSNNNPVRTSFSVAETYSNLSTNSCGNGNPSSSSCAAADSGGQFLDSMAVSGNLCNSGINRSSGCGFTLTSTWSICSGNTQNAIWTSTRETRSNGVKVNGQSTSYTPGTYLYP